MIKSKLRRSLFTASVLVATGATALLGAGSAYASGNGGAWVSGRDVTVGSGDGSIYTCPLGDVCMYTGTGYTGTMFAFGHCEVYSLSNWDGYGSWVNNQTVGNSYSTYARVYGASGNVIDSLSPYAPYWNASYNWEPAWSVQPCGNY